MLKRLLTTGAFIVLTIVLSAQSQPFQRGSQFLSFGLNAGSDYLTNDYYGNYKIQIPQILLTYDYGITDEVGIGFIGIGFQLGVYSFKNAGSTYYTYFNSATVTYGTMRVMYHFDMYDITREPVFQFLDLYAGPMFGIAYRSVNNDDHSNIYTLIPIHELSNEGGGIFGVIIGGRYNFSRTTGVFLELSVAQHSGVNAGISFRLH